ncbi:MlaD family protein [Fundidesulfovibrio terrae]|uniref:MlaD family protein n=1 Tax=Fundidesulfovibrio terrae TaxID=2922866 RepID=UPI001FAE7903
MSAKSNKTMIGLFVLGAALLAVAAMAAFGSGMFFTKKMTAIMFFDGSVSGLEVGSPVIFRGVPLGSVKDVRIEADPTGLKFAIPVVVEIVGGKVNLQKAGAAEGETLLEARKQSPKALVQALIDKGLRAQLVTQSFVTGQLAVSLDMRPDTPVRLHGDGDDLEIPTIPSEFEKLTQTLKSLPLEELVAHLLSAVNGVERLVNSPETAKIPAKIDTALTSGTQLVDDLRGRVDGLAKNLEQAVRSYNELAVNLDQRTDKLTASTRKTLDSLDGAVADGKSALTKFQKVVSPDAATVVELNRALAEIAQAAKAIRGLADYLERHPEALIQGKGGNRR